jgi:hypothetical protein
MSSGSSRTAGGTPSPRTRSACRRRRAGDRRPSRETCWLRTGHPLRYGDGGASWGHRLVTSVRRCQLQQCGAQPHRVAREGSWTTVWRSAMAPGCCGGRSAAVDGQRFHTSRHHRPMPESDRFASCQFAGDQGLRGAIIGGTRRRRAPAEDSDRRYHRSDAARGSKARAAIGRDRGDRRHGRTGGHRHCRSEAGERRRPAPRAAALSASRRSTGRRCAIGGRTAGEEGTRCRT